MRQTKVVDLIRRSSSRTYIEVQLIHVLVAESVGGFKAEAQHGI
jgi:hypothetical protein